MEEETLFSFPLPPARQSQFSQVSKLEQDQEQGDQISSVYTVSLSQTIIINQQQQWMAAAVVMAANE